jgi:ATP-dependent exoDNAse (exonuclease V) alpha subunit
MIKYNSSNYSTLNTKYEYLIIDEKSMVKELMWRIMIHIKKSCPQLKFIIIGNWLQLPAVADRANFDYENSTALMYLCDNYQVELTKCRRSDNIMYDLCNPATINDVNTASFEHEIYKKSICFHNSVRMSVNKHWMNIEKDDDSELLEKFKRDKLSQDMYLYKGLPLMACITSKHYDICNSEDYIVKSFGKKMAKLQAVFDENKIFEMKITELTRFFYPNYCTTTHKSQGSTFREPYTIYEWSEMSERCRYVALSRTEDKKFVNFCENTF